MAKKSKKVAPVDRDHEEDTEERETSVIDILGNGQLIKRTSSQGLGRESRPSHGDKVVLDYEINLEDGTVVQPRSTRTAVLGDGDFIQAIDLALPLTQMKETFIVECDPRFGPPLVPPNAKLIIKGQLLKSSDPPVYSEMSLDQRCVLADEKRVRGNFYYRREEYSFALNMYDKALTILDAANDIDASGARRDLEIKLWNNLAATQLKVQNFDAAIRSCDKILQIDPDNSKALFRKGKAHCSFGDTDVAIPLFNRVLELKPECQLAKLELDAAKNMLLKERRQLARAASKLFPINRTKTDSRAYAKSSKSMVGRSFQLYHDSYQFGRRARLLTVFVLVAAVLIGSAFYAMSKTIEPGVIQLDDQTQP